MPGHAGAADADEVDRARCGPSDRSSARLRGFEARGREPLGRVGVRLLARGLGQRDRACRRSLEALRERARAHSPRRARCSAIADARAAGREVPRVAPSGGRRSRFANGTRIAPTPTIASSASVLPPARATTRSAQRYALGDVVDERVDARVRLRRPRTPRALVDAGAARPGAKPRAAAAAGIAASAAAASGSRFARPGCRRRSAASAARRARASSRSRGESVGAIVARTGVADHLVVAPTRGSCPGTTAKIRAASGASKLVRRARDRVLLVQQQRPAREPRPRTRRARDEAAHAEHGRGPAPAQRARAPAAARAAIRNGARDHATNAACRARPRSRSIRRRCRASARRAPRARAACRATTTVRSPRAQRLGDREPGNTCPPVPPAMIMIGRDDGSSHVPALHDAASGRRAARGGYGTAGRARTA